MKTQFTKGQSVKYIGKGFLGFSKDHLEMTIIEKVSFLDYKVEYLDFELLVSEYELESVKS